ncbi:MAG TPA: FecR domain-containing protein [Opitutaceae bacterium]|nr:FecR domain-containing protein [Opitutaceae bacterium]
MNAHDEADARLDLEAAQWLVRRDRGLNAEEQDAFSQWLAADPRHGEWFSRHQRTWKEFNLLAQWRPEHSAEPNPDLLAKPARRYWRLTWVAPLAAAAALAIGLFLWSRVATTPDTGSIAHVGSRVLEDGSTVELRAGSEIRVLFTAEARRVELLHGEAFFTVAKNAARPFIVHAQGVDVRAVGTAFNVRFNQEHVEVLVTEGKVQVERPDLPSAPASAAVVASSPAARPEGMTAIESRLVEPQLVAAGERMVVTTLAAAQVLPPQVTPLSEAEISRELAWQPRLLDFDATPLAEVISEFNSRNRLQLVLEDPELGRMPIIASVRSDNVEGFIRLLESTASIRVKRRGDVITLRAVR